jgi:hypothetical protein
MVHDMKMVNDAGRIIKRVTLVAAVLLSFATCFAQHGWTVPNLKELSEKDAVGSGVVQLSPDEVKLLKQLARREFAICGRDPVLWGPKSAAEFFNALRVERVALIADGKQVLVVQGIGFCVCGATGNCPIWVIGGNANPQLLLHSEGIQTFAFQQSQGSDHFDLILGSHDSAMESYLQKYRLDGSKYRRTGCATLEWADGVGNEFDPPRITVRRCD